MDPVHFLPAAALLTQLVSGLVHRVPYLLIWVWVLIQPVPQAKNQILS